MPNYGVSRSGSFQIRAHVERSGLASIIRRFMDNARGDSELIRRFEDKLFEKGVRIIQKAQSLCPVSDPYESRYYPGNLRDSGYVVGRNRLYRNNRAMGDTGGVVEKAISHANSIDRTKAVFLLGFSAWYFLPVHERLDLHHEVGQAEFLKIAWNAHKGDITKWNKKQGRALVEAMTK